ncbi:glycosylated lysosomal membrane protein A-like [Phymastichus coffea]|uniref:glycosylated lysosomal membrane protein A-like n=1 Tax=Phymastichus coffea TaxID=108790 RepID=UPI00273ACDBB|nr:glycosylated lysosomal membrane protein A-like [Phymastichus coffea]
MIGTKYQILLLAVISLIFIGRSNCLKRNLDYAFNEGCDILCKDKNAKLGHVIANGLNDTLHYLWDFTDIPTIFIALTSHNAKLHINWHEYLKGSQYSVNFTEKPFYTFGVAIDRILEFQDGSDTARIDTVKDNDIKELLMKNFQWHHKNLTKHDSFVEFYTEANNYKDPDTNKTRKGSLKFLVHGFGSQNHSFLMPCMLHSENATQVDIIVDNLETSENFNQSRFAFELIIVSEHNASSTLVVDATKKLDDEFTPGTFEVMKLRTPKINNKLGYLQWRPVSYTHIDRDVTNSTGTVYYPLQKAVVDNYFSNNLLYKYYGEGMYDVLVQRMNISMGEKRDKFYKATNYTTWTYIVGYGVPLDEKFSVMVILMIAIGVGLPTILLSVAAIYVCLRQRRQQSRYEEPILR